MSPDPLPTGFRAALQTICTALAPYDLIWALTGSASFALQGLQLPVKDIDLQADAAGAYAVEAALVAYVERPVQCSSTGRIRSHYGSLRLDGIQVEIIGDVQHRLNDGSWSAVPDLAAARGWISQGALTVPVMSLAHEALAYERMGRLPTALALSHFSRSRQTTVWPAEKDDPAPPK